MTQNTSCHVCTTKYQDSLGSLTPKPLFFISITLLTFFFLTLTAYEMKRTPPPKKKKKIHPFQSGVTCISVKYRILTKSLCVISSALMGLMKSIASKNTVEFWIVNSCRRTGLHGRIHTEIGTQLNLTASSGLLFVVFDVWDYLLCWVNWNQGKIFRAFTSSSITYKHLNLLKNPLYLISNYLVRNQPIFTTITTDPVWTFVVIQVASLIIVSLVDRWWHCRGPYIRETPT